MISLLRGAPAHQDTRETRVEFNARIYGPGWEETKRRYWASRFTRKRCVWCCGLLGRATQLNHLTYLHSDATGACPFWVLAPMCRRCHRIETWVTERARRRMPRGGPKERVRDEHGNTIVVTVYPMGRRGRYGLIRHQKWAHAIVTFRVWLAIRVAMLGASVTLVLALVNGCTPGPATGGHEGTSHRHAAAPVQASRCADREPLAGRHYEVVAGTSPGGNAGDAGCGPASRA